MHFGLGITQLRVLRRQDVGLYLNARVPHVLSTERRATARDMQLFAAASTQACCKMCWREWKGPRGHKGVWGFNNRTNRIRLFAQTRSEQATVSLTLSRTPSGDIMMCLKGNPKPPPKPCIPAECAPSYFMKSLNRNSPSGILPTLF